MHGFRKVARLSPRSLQFASPRLTHSAARVLSRPCLNRIPVVAATRSANFSTFRPQRNEALVAKLDSELAIENDIAAEEEASARIAEYLSASPYTLEDTKGSDDVSLVRAYGDEEIKITFSTESLRSGQMLDPDSIDPALEDEDGENAQGEDEDGEGVDPNQTPIAIAVNIQVAKPDKGALVIAAYIDPEARFAIEHVAFHSTKELAEASTPEADIQRRTLYSGPAFEELDEELQSNFDEYLRERNIDDAMALFIPEYIEKKESTEYQEWLKNVKSFLS